MRKIMIVLSSLLVISFANVHADVSLAGNWTCNYQETDKDGSVISSIMKLGLNQDNSYTSETTMKFESPVINASHKIYVEGTWSIADEMLVLDGVAKKYEHISGMDMTAMMKPGKKEVMKKKYEVNGNSMSLHMTKGTMSCTR